jgi:hypothetical protein
MRGVGVIAGVALLTLVAVGDDPKPPVSRLKISPAVVCTKIDGYRRFKPRKPVELTKDEKLVVYYEPTGHQTESRAGVFRAHLVQDGSVRRATVKSPVWEREKMVEYKPEASTRPDYLYIESTVSLKTLEPGEYVFDIVLRDIISGSTATQSVPFMVIKRPAESEADPKSTTDRTPSSPTKRR